MQRQVGIEEAMARSLPLPLAIAIVKDPSGKFNPISVAWAMNASKEPPMIAISIGRTRYSFEGFEANRYFVVANPSSTRRGHPFFSAPLGRDDNFGFQQPTEPAIASTVLPARCSRSIRVRTARQARQRDHALHRKFCCARAEDPSAAV